MACGLETAAAAVYLKSYIAIAYFFDEMAAYWVKRWLVMEPYSLSLEKNQYLDYECLLVL